MTTTTTMPIRDALGRKVACPTVSGRSRCGQPATVEHARGRLLGGPAASAAIRTAALWYRCECPACGAKMYRAGTPVEVIG